VKTASLTRQKSRELEAGRVSGLQKWPAQKFENIALRLRERANYCLICFMVSTTLSRFLKYNLFFS